MLLQIPDIRMNPDGYDCGAVCVDAVAEFYGLRKRGPAKHIRTALGSLPNAIAGTSPETVTAMLRALGLKVLPGPMRISDLKHFANTGRPVLCPVSLHGGHWVCVRGVAYRQVHYHDPIDGAKSMNEQVWLGHWSDTSDAGHTFSRWGIVVSKD